MYTRLFACFVLLCSFQGVFGQNTSVFRKQYYENAEISISVVDLTTKKTIAEFHTSPLVTPASIQKLVTTSAAIEMLGPDFRFKTTLVRYGDLIDGVLDGNLVIVGGGDPTLGSKQFFSNQESFLHEWTDAIQKAGIRHIKGEIIVQSGCYDNEGVSPFWLWEDIGNYYATGIYGLNVYDNSFNLNLKSLDVGSKPSILSVEPDVPALTIENNLIVANNSQDSAYLYGAPFQNEMRLFGSMPANRDRFTIRGQIPNPSVLLVSQLTKALNRIGISIDQVAKRGVASKGVEIITTKSPLLSDIVDLIHEKSDNFYTECLLKQLALQKGVTPATSNEGIRIVKAFWNAQGLDVSSLFMYDASGLSPNDRLSATFMTNLLVRMRSMKHGQRFEESIPLAGKEGTVANFLKDTPLEGKVRLKSGSNQVVNSYAGYYRYGVKNYAVAMVVNHAQTSRSNIRKDLAFFLLSL